MTAVGVGVLAQSQNFTVTPLDLTVILAYLVITIGIGYWYSQRSGGNEDSEGYFLGGRNFIWPFVGFSLLATNMSGSSFVGFAAAGYTTGVNVYNYEWMATVVLIFAALFIFPIYLRSRVYTMPEFLERRFDRRSRYAFSGFTIVANLFVDAAGALYAGGVVIQTIYPNWPLWQIILGLAIVAGAYTIVGGLAAVVITDTIQAIVLMIGGAIVFFAAMNAIDSVDAVRQAAPDGAFSVVLPPADEAMPWPGILLGVLPIGFYFWVTNQVIVQRTLGARSIDHGRWGMLFAGALKLPMIFLMILPGLLAIQLFPNLDNPDLAFPTLVFDLLPAGVRGIVLAALVAAIMSSLDSVLNSVSTLVTVDFVETFADFDERTQVRIGRIATVVFTILAIIWSPQIQNFPNIVAYFQSFLAYLTPPVIVTFLMGLFWKRSTSPAAFWTIAIGFPVGVVLWIGNEVLLPDRGLMFLYACGILCALWAIMFYVISINTEMTNEDVDELTFSWDVWRAESEELAGKPWYKNYRTLAAILGVATVLFVLPWIPGIPNGFGG
jgi:SSS family solute:Na+ symporter